MVLSFFGASCQKGGEGFSSWQSAFNFCNEHLVCNNFIRLTIVMHVVMA
jgi:hypothetical protein